MQECFNLREPAALAAMWQDTRELGFNMASEPLGCSLLRTLAASKPAAKPLEFGSGTGLSTAWLPSIKGQVFDLIFADAWAGKYRLVDETLALLKSSGIYVVDDMLPQPNWPDGHGVKASTLIAMLEQRTDLTVTKLSWASGLVVAVKR
jgi:predicted O-methyltransferase YrrM